ncbi:MAG TPA: hypothetical protein VKV04_09050 [Verrucomicrobiae bacterium]|nr:hypothetical protein [Verrucomicrobiae bacterium]
MLPKFPHSSQKVGRLIKDCGFNRATSAATRSPEIQPDHATDFAKSIQMTLSSFAWTVLKIFRVVQKIFTAFVNSEELWKSLQRRRYGALLPRSL